MQYTIWDIATAVAPASEPVTLTEAKTHLRVVGTDDDTYITALISVARASVEEYLSRSLINRTLDLFLDSLPYSNDVLILPRGPVSSITSITYYDSNNTLQTESAANYQLSNDRVLPVSGYTWPDTYDRLNPVTVRYVAGYGSAASSIPADIVHAVKLLISHWYELREPVNVGNITSALPMMVEFLLNPHRLRWAGLSDYRR